MAAVRERPGDFIIDIAVTGKELITAYAKFITYRKVTDRRLENLYATLSITASKLEELGSTVNLYEMDFEIKDEVTHPICETAKTNLERLLILIKEGISSGVWKNDGKIGDCAVAAEVDPWFLITMALGGREEAKAFWKSLDDTRDTLIELNDIVKYMALKDLDEKNALTLGEAEEFNRLVALLPHICQSIEKAEKASKVAAAAKARKERVIIIEDHSDSPRQPRRYSDAASDCTLIVDSSPRRRQTAMKDTDCHSISSFSSAVTRSTVASIQEDVIYEDWVLIWDEPTKKINRSWSFLGLKFKNYYEDPGFWATDPEYRTQEELREKEIAAMGDLSKEEHMKKIQKTVQAIKWEGGCAIDVLVNERSEASNNGQGKRKWSVVAVEPRQRYPYGSSKKWGSNPHTTAWVVTLRAETIDTLERSRNMRRENPWHKRDRSRSRSYSPPRRWDPPQPRRYNAPRTPPPPPTLPRAQTHVPPPPHEAVPDEGFHLGKVYVGKVLSKEEAKERIEKVWTGMINRKSPVVRDN